MKPRRSRSVRTVMVVTGILSCAVVVYAAVNLAPSGNTPRVRARVVTNAQIRATLIAHGLGPAELTAAGLTPNQAIVLVGNARAHLQGGALLTAEENLAQSKTLVGHLAQLAQSGKASAEQIRDLAEGRATLATREATAATARANFINAAVAGLGESVQAGLATLRTNTHWPVPIELRTASRTEAQWVVLRDAAVQERSDGRAPQVLLDARAESAAAAALAAASDSLAAVTTAWNQASD